MIQDRRSPTVVLFNDAIQILRESEVIGIERNNPPTSRIRELWPLPADVLVVLFEQLKPLAYVYDTQPTRSPNEPVPSRDQELVYNAVVAASNLARALDLAAKDGVKPRANRPPTTAELAAYWARYADCPTCGARAARPCYDLRRPTAEDALPAKAPHRHRTIQPALNRRRTQDRETR